MRLADLEDKRYGVNFEITLNGISKRDVDDIAQRLGGRVVKRHFVDGGEFDDDQIKYEIEYGSRQEAEHAWKQLTQSAGRYIHRARLIK